MDMPHVKQNPSVSQFFVILAVHSEETTCQDVVKEEKVWEKEALSVTGRC